MALCSQAFAAPLKRGCCNLDNDSNSKRLCLGINKSITDDQSSSDFDSDDEQACYQADQIRAKKRASNRVSFTFNNISNSILSRAVSQYSDDDENDTEEYHRRSCDSPTGSTLAIGKVARSASFVSTSAAMGSDPHADCRLSAGTNSIYPSVLFSDDVSSNKKEIPDSDKQCRARCFDYLVGAIDEAWARYCDATTSVEDEVYGYSSGVGRCPADTNTPASVATDEEDYFANATDFTDYDDSDFDINHKGAQVSRRPLLMPVQQVQGNNGPSYSAKDPSSCQLQALKDRLTKAKYYLQDLTDSDIFQDVIAFWKRWDMIKYATIELVEDDDDDEVVESTIEELERGRMFVH
jgi:hypothetical protein